MGIEIERKFLVKSNEWKTAKGVYYSQGYLNSDKLRTVRVRIAGDKAYLTIKGQSQGASRAEFEYAISLADAEQLLQLCEQPLIQKQRYRISYEGLVWEVDEFLGDNQGLVVAEVELTSENQSIPLPNWVGEEVTHDIRYFNSNLVKHPFKQWVEKSI